MEKAKTSQNNGKGQDWRQEIQKQIDVILGEIEKEKGFLDGLVKECGKVFEYQEGRIWTKESKPQIAQENIEAIRRQLKQRQFERLDLCMFNDLLGKDDIASDILIVMALSNFLLWTDEESLNSLSQSGLDLPYSPLRIVCTILEECSTNICKFIEDNEVYYMPKANEEGKEAEHDDAA